MAVEGSGSHKNSVGSLDARTPVGISHPVGTSALLRIADAELAGGLGGRAQRVVNRFQVLVTEAKHVSVLDTNHRATTVALGSARIEGRA